jgi:hypothetical protein
MCEDQMGNEHGTYRAQRCWAKGRVNGDETIYNG